MQGKLDTAIMSYKVTTEPVVEPLTLEDAKEYLRIQNNDEDQLIAQLIIAARSYCEEELDLAIVEQTITLKLDSFPDSRVIYLPRSNLLDVTSVSYLDQDNASQTFTDYTKDIYSTPGRIINNTNDWPTTTDDANAVTIVYTAGFGEYSESSGAPVPGAVDQAMKMLVTHFYENRTPVVIGNTANSIEMAVTACLQKYRRMGL